MAYNDAALTCVSVPQGEGGASALLGCNRFRVRIVLGMQEQDLESWTDGRLAVAAQARDAETPCFSRICEP